jgi:predicted nuclease of predicted toxin-antitoxin system
MKLSERITIDPAICHGKPTRKPWKLVLVSTGNIGNDELLSLFERNIRQILEYLRVYDFVEINRSSITCHI